MVSWAALDKVLPAVQRRWSVPSAEHWWGYTCSTVSSSELLSTKEMWTYWREPNKGPRRLLRDWTISPMREGWDRLAWWREGSGGIFLMYINTLRKGAKRTDSGSFLWCPVTGPEAVGMNWNTGGSLWTWGNTFLLRATEQWNRLLRKVVDSPSLEILESHLDAVLASQLCVALLEWQFGADDLQRCLPTSISLWFWFCEQSSSI